MIARSIMATGRRAAAPPGTLPTHSALFNNSAASFLVRTPLVAADPFAWTLSFWFRTPSWATQYPAEMQDSFGNAQNFLCTGSSGGQLRVQSSYGGGGTHHFTTGNLVDTWLHLFFQWDTNSGGDTARVVLDNGFYPLALDTDPNPGASSVIGSTGPQYWGKTEAAANGWPGEVFDVYFIDGNTTLLPTDFGFDDAGTWTPIAYAGTYPGESYHLDFENAGDLGADVSGNALDFTTNGTVTQSTAVPP